MHTNPAIARTLVLLISVASIARATDQSNQLWHDVDERSLDQTAKRLLIPTAYRTTRLDPLALKKVLAAAPMEFTRPPNQNPLISLPMPDGTFARFRFEEAPIMEPGLAAKFPNFKTYRAQGMDDPNATCRFDFLPTGFHAIILLPSGTVLIDPYALGNRTDYISYWKRDATNSAGPFECRFVDPRLPSFREESGSSPTIFSGGTLRTYRLALAANSEYSAVAGGGTVGGTLAAQILVMNRVNGVYERDVDIRMTLISNNDLIIYTDPATDPYNDPVTILDVNQANLDNVIGSANYDIGHVFTGSGGGIAQLSVPCTSSKARGATGLSDPVGDPFSIDYVAHEMGHQWGASHTFNGTSGSCGGGNRSASHAYEPGSGITIMAYAGICGNQNLAAHSIDAFHYDSLNSIIQYSQSGNGNSCAVQTATGNTPPSITGLGNFNIPKQTPFSLTASATDINNDSITYDWQEFDLGPGTTAVPNTDADGQARPIFRVYLPTAAATRTFPSLQYILNNANAPPATTDLFLTGELLPAITRTMVFQSIVRDNRANGGGINSVTSNVFVTASAGPFAITAPDSSVIWTGGTTENVTWNVSNTNAAPVNAANVKISLSTDGGNTFPIIILANTPNDGIEAITVPNVETTTARIKVEAVNNIFFDISGANFTIHFGTGPTPPDTTPTPTPPSTVTISGTIIYCPNPSVHPVPGVTVTLSGTAAGSTQTNDAGDYLFTGLPAGGNYSIAPTKAPLPPGAIGINTIDVVATQRHFLAIAPLPPGCRLGAADVNGDTTINTVDVVAIQRFFLGLSTGTANVGKYVFNPVRRTYLGVTTNQANQNYDALVLGDTASAFVHRPNAELPPRPMAP